MYAVNIICADSDDLHAIRKSRIFVRTVETNTLYNSPEPLKQIQCNLAGIIIGSDSDDLCFYKTLYIMT
jgi:hypothetical protein